MMIKRTRINRNVKRMLKSIVAAAPAIPYVMRRRRTPAVAFVLGGLGIAATLGLAALMFLSPRTRSRALHAAKDTYEKMNDTIVHRRKRGEETMPMSNGLVDRVDVEESTAGI